MRVRKKKRVLIGWLNSYEFFNIGIGSLLTNYQFFPDRGDSLKGSYFTVVLENLVKGALDNLTSEDKL
jgi:hypothetical protein